MAIIADEVFLDFAVEEKRPASFAANRGVPTFTRGVYLHPGHFYDFASEGYLVVSLITQGNDFAQGIADAPTFLR
jgi:hypothetical protein